MSKDEIGLLVFGTMLVATVIYFIVLNVRHKRRQKTNPSRHRGEYQSQKGRVYDNGVSHRAQGSEMPGAGANLISVDPEYAKLPRYPEQGSKKARDFALKAASDQSNSGE